MKLLVFGSNSPLGQSFTQLLERESIPFVAIRDDEPDIYEGSVLFNLIKNSQADQLLNLSLDPGLFQSEAIISKQREDRLTEACATLIKVAGLLKTPLIHHSSVAVFDGSNAIPYLETDACKPKNPLGKLALSLEKKVSKYQRHIILRTEGIFEFATTFFKDCIKTFKEQEGKLILLDQRCSPTPIIDVARVLLAINRQLDCNAIPWGVFHYCSLQATHRHTFVEDFLTEASNYDSDLKALMPKLEINTQESTKVQLENSVVDCQKIMASFGIKQRSRGLAVKELIEAIYD